MLSKGLGLLGKGLEIQRFEGLDTQGYPGLVGYSGLDTLKRGGLSRPVQIVRQTISNLDTQICRVSPISQILRFVKPLKNQGIKRIYQTSIGSIWTYAGYEGLMV